MPRAVPRAAGAFLAIAVMVSVPLARAQAPSLQYQGRPMPMRKAASEENLIRAGEQGRLEEMKVELALLNDMTTFPYSLGTSVRGPLLELYGFVPNDIVRKRVVELARHNTQLTVKDSLGIRNDLDPRPAVRPAQVLRQEGAELVQRNLSEISKQISLEARADGVIVLTGSTDSLETKLEVSRLFRQLSGCTGVENKLTIAQIEQNGQHMVKITRDGSLLVPSTAISLRSLPSNSTEPCSEKVELASFPAASRAANQQPASNVLPQTPVPVSSVNAKQDEPLLPTALAPQQSITQAKSPSGDVGGNIDAAVPPKLPVKWGRPTGSWETQLNQLETARSPSTPGRTNTESHADFAEARTAPASDMTWRRPGGNEESEPSRATPTIDSDPPSKSMPIPTPSGPPLRSSRRWPPAYATGKPASEGRPGIITFEDEEPVAAPVSRTAPPTPAVTRPAVVPANLLRQVKSACGRQARDVSVVVQRDGSLLVKVKVANRTLEDQLSRKILSIPEMSLPQVRLWWEIEP